MAEDDAMLLLDRVKRLEEAGPLDDARVGAAIGRAAAGWEKRIAELESENALLRVELEKAQSLQQVASDKIVDLGESIHSARNVLNSEKRRAKAGFEELEKPVEGYDADHHAIADEHCFRLRALEHAISVHPDMKHRLDTYEDEENGDEQVSA